MPLDKKLVLRGTAVRQHPKELAVGSDRLIRHEVVRLQEHRLDTRKVIVLKIIAMCSEHPVDAAVSGLCSHR